MTTAPEKKGTVSLWRRCWPPAFLLASTAFVIWHFREEGTRVAKLGPLDWRFLAAALVLQLSYLAINTLCWHSTVRWYAGVRLTWLASFRQLTMAALGKYFPGKVWGMIARADALKQAGVPLRRSALATINEQFLLLYASLLICTLSWLLIRPDGYAATAALAAGAGLFALPRLQRWTLGLRLVHRIFHENFSETGENNVLNLSQILFLVGCYSAIWVISGLTIGALYYAIFGGNPTLAMFAQLIVANTIGISIGFFAVFSPGGLGIREAITGAMLAAHIGAESAVLLCLAFRLWIVAFELLGGLSLLMREGKTTGNAPRND